MKVEILCLTYLHCPWNQSCASFSVFEGTVLMSLHRCLRRQWHCPSCCWVVLQWWWSKTRQAEGKRWFTLCKIIANTAMIWGPSHIHIAKSCQAKQGVMTDTHTDLFASPLLAGWSRPFLTVPSLGVFRAVLLVGKPAVPHHWWLANKLQKNQSLLTHRQ